MGMEILRKIATQTLNPPPQSNAFVCMPLFSMKHLSVENGHTSKWGFTGLHAKLAGHWAPVKTGFHIHLVKFI